MQILRWWQRVTLDDIKAILKTTGLPVVYNAWPENAAPPLPYLCYLSPGTDNFAADGKTYHVINQINIELYTKFKDPELEGKVEEALSSVFWDKTETWIESERCFQVLYEIEV